MGFVGALARRDFWSFRAMHALAGGLLTVIGAGQALFVNESMKAEVARIDRQVAYATQRIASINSALDQFRTAQSTFMTVRILAYSQGRIDPAFEKLINEHILTTRAYPTQLMLSQLFFGAEAEFRKQHDAYGKLVDEARQTTGLVDMSKLDAFELETTQRSEMCLAALTP